MNPMVSPCGKYLSDSSDYSTSSLMIINEALFNLGPAYTHSLIFPCCLLQQYWAAYSSSNKPCCFTPCVCPCCSPDAGRPPFQPGNCPSPLLRPAGTCSGNLSSFPQLLLLSVLRWRSASYVFLTFHVCSYIVFVSLLILLHCWTVRSLRLWSVYLSSEPPELMIEPGS